MLTALCQSRQLSSLGTCKGSHLSSTDRKPAGGNDSAELELGQTPTKESKKINQKTQQQNKQNLKRVCEIEGDMFEKQS